MDGEGWGWLWLPLIIGMVFLFGYLDDKNEVELQKACIQAGKVWEDGNCKTP